MTSLLSLFTELIQFTTPKSKIVQENLEHNNRRFNNSLFLSELEKENEYICQLYHARYDYYASLKAIKLLEKYLRNIIDYCYDQRDWNKVFNEFKDILRNINEKEIYCITKILVFEDFLKVFLNNIEKSQKLELIKFCQDYNISLFHYGSLEIFLDLCLELNSETAFSLIEKKIYNNFTKEELIQIITGTRNPELNTKIMLSLHFNAITSHLWFDDYLNLWENYCLLEQIDDLIEKIKCWIQRLDNIRVVERLDDDYYSYTDYAKYEQQDFERIFHEWFLPFPDLFLQSRSDFYIGREANYFSIYDEEYEKVEKYIYHQFEILEKKYILYSKLKKNNSLDVFKNIISYLVF